MTTGKISIREQQPLRQHPDWDEIAGLLATRSSTGSSGRRQQPRAVPLVGVWHDGAFAFCTGERREAAQPRREPARRGDDRQHRCARLADRQGRRRRGHGGARDRARALQELADAWSAKYGDDWRFAVRGDEFVELSDSGGSTEGGARVYRVEATKAMVFGDDHGQTTYRF